MHRRLVVAVGLLIACCGACFGQAVLSITPQRDAPLVGLPFTADFSATTTQHLADGTTIVHRITGRSMRSSAGLERLDGTVVPLNPGGKVPSTQTWIVDRSQHTATLLNNTLRTAIIRRLPPNTSMQVGFLPSGNQPGASGAQPPGKVSRETLEPRTQDGFALTGQRTTHTFEAGVVGNEEPFQATTEVWTMPQLKLVVSRTVRDPRTGETRTELTNVQAQEPDASLFSIPADYKVSEEKVGGALARPAPTAPPASGTP